LSIVYYFLIYLTNITNLFIFPYMIQLVESQSHHTKIIFLTTESVKEHEQASTFEKLDFEGKFGQISYFPESDTVFIGIEYKLKVKTSDIDAKPNYYSLGAKIAKYLCETKVTAVEITTLPKEYQSSKVIQQIILGISQGSWQFDKYLNKKSSTKKNYDISFATGLEDILTSGDMQELFALDKGISLNRTLVEETPENLNPESIQRILKSEFQHYQNITHEIINYDQLQARGMEGITAVGRGSRFKPILSHMILKPKNQISTSRVCLIGKGLTYDSGGMDIKTKGHMRTMKMDMGGSALMTGVMKTLAELGGLEHTEVHWISAYAENMVNDDSYKADDILTTYSGQTVEVWNTDAEGRLTLADALSYATMQDPKYIVDAATLTGACVRAVSEYYAAIMGNDKDLIGAISSSFVEQGELAVHTPLPEVLRASVKGELSDLINTSLPGTNAGHLTAGLFLSHFVDQNNFRGERYGKITQKKAYPWVHLDIAGSAYNSKKNDLGTSGATGHGVKSLVSWLRGLES
jgi:leucyl aminopeptidase